MRSAAGIVALLALACESPPPEPIVAPLAMPASFSEPGGEPLPQRWWESLADPELDFLIARALEGNFDLRGAWDRLAQAEAIARRDGAALWPALDGQAGAGTSKIRQFRDGTTSRSSPNDFSLGLFASYEVDLWGRVRSLRDAAALDLHASAEELRAAAITLSAQVATTWYRFVEQNGQIALLDSQIETNETVLKVIRERFGRGKGAASDVLRQRQLVESTRGERVLAVARRELIAHLLATLLGEAPRVPDLPQRSELQALPALPATGLPAELVAERPDIRRRWLAVLAADSRLAVAEADRYPRITLSAGASTSAEKIHQLFDSWVLNLSSDLLQPLFDGGRRSAEVDRNRAVVSERIHAYGQVILDALGEVEDALFAERQQRAYIASLEKQLELSRVVLTSIELRFRKGTVEYINVLEALATRQRLQRDLLRARRELVEFRIDLCRALGGGWELERPQPAELERAE